MVGGLHVLRGQLTIGSLMVVIAYLGAVYGPLSAIAHTTGSLQGALASTRRVRRMFALKPEVSDGSPGSTRSTAETLQVRGHVTFESVGFGYEGHRPCCTTSASRPSRARWSRSSA